MKALKDLKVGDECFVMQSHRGSNATFAKAKVTKAGRKWIETDYRKGFRSGYVFDVEKGRHKTDYLAMAFLFPSEDVYQKMEEKRVKRIELQTAIRDSGVLMGATTMTTEALERIVAIIRDPASNIGVPG